MKLAVNRAHYPVTVLGPGRRIGIWLQGCSIRCPACVSQDTWAADRGRQMPVADLLAWCRAKAAEGVDGITLTGGEPFDQPRALAALLDGLMVWRKQAALDFDLLVYSGYPESTLRTRHAGLLHQIDALIPEPFREEEALTHLWRGSANQPLLPLSERGRRVYGEYLDAPALPAEKRLQIALDGDRLWAIGIPARGDLARLEALATARGLSLLQSSWHER